ncbi:MAG TPA: hypothetical protein VF783_25420 [Terriglobales bacterium]
MKPLDQIDRRTPRKFTAAFFVLVITGFALVEAVHVHDRVAKQTSPRSRCSLCVVAHNAAVVTPVNAALAPVVTSAALAISDPQLQSQLQVASAFIRPPPQSL